jgi:hypothetical protein
MLDIQLENTIRGNEIGNNLIKSIVNVYKGEPPVLGPAVFFSLMTAFELALFASKRIQDTGLKEKIQKYADHDTMPTLLATFTGDLGQKALVVAVDIRNISDYRQTVETRLKDVFGIEESDFTNVWVDNGEMKIRSNTSRRLCDIKLFTTYFMCDEDRNICESLGWTVT